MDRIMDKPFYEFYRDVKIVLEKMKDIHLMLIPNFNNASKYIAYIPFNFNTKKFENYYQLYMKENVLCPFIYSVETINHFINNTTENNLNNISSINDKDPFDFIQNLGKEFFELKSNHSHFTKVVKYISNFPLYIFSLMKQN